MTWTPGQPLRLETERFVLRSLRPEDICERMVKWINDPEIMAYVAPRGTRVTAGQLKAQTRRADNSSSFFLGVFCRDPDLLIGNYRINCSMPNRSAETTVVIGDRDYWGKRVVIETRAAILEFLFGRLEIEKVTGHPFVRNFPAVFNYKAQGFRCEGVFLKHVRLRDGSRLDQYAFAMLREEWLARGEGGEA